MNSRRTIFKNKNEYAATYIYPAPSMVEPASASCDDFPYKRENSDMKREIERRFINLTTYQPTFRSMRYRINNAPEFTQAQLRFHNAPLLMVFDASDYEKYNLISDYFIEQHRIRAYRGDDPKHESVFDYWCAHRAEIHAACSGDRHCMREMIYKNKMEVGTFRPTVAVGLAQMMRTRHHTTCDWVLNPCAGWGDRLLGFMAAKCKGSVDIDPNTELGAEYPKMREWAQDMLRVYNPRSEARQFKHTYIPRPFEDIPNEELLGALDAMRAPERDTTRDTSSGISREPAQGFDLVLIAPPYFDLEVYVPDDRAGTQSISRYRTFEEWYQKFLIANLKKCGDLLRKGGLLALIINQTPAARTDEKERFLLRMIRDVTRAGSDNHARLRYLGVISYAEVSRAHVRSPQPIWLWTRI